MPFDYQSWTATSSKHCEYPTSTGTLSRYFAIADRIIQVNIDQPELDQALGEIIGHLEITDFPGSADNSLNILQQQEGRFLLQLHQDEQRSMADLNEAVIEAVNEIVERACDYRRRLMVLHASGLCEGSSAIVFPGSGGSGKSTLVAKLASRGLTFMGDDVLPVDLQSGQIYGVPIALCLKADSWPVINHFYEGIDALPVYQRHGLATRFIPPPGPVWRNKGTTRVRAIFFPRWSADAGFELKPLDRTHAFARLVQSESVMGFQGANLPAVADWLQGIDVYQLDYSNIDQAADEVEKIVAGF